MKEKIKARLRALFPGVNLSAARIDAIADKLASKITEEDQIDEKLNDLNDINPFSDIAKQDDKLRSLESAAKKAANGGTSTETENKTDDPANEVPAWAKGLVTTVETLQKQLAGEKTKNAAAELVAAAKAKGIVISERYAKAYVSEEGYDPETALTELEAEWTGQKQFVANAQVGGGQVPAGGNQQQQQQQTKVAPEISNFTKGVKAQADGVKPKSV